jgi:hypothetical protein
MPPDDLMGGWNGGVGATAPPRASFFGVMSLSLVLADFGTLFFFLLFISCSLLLCLFHGDNHRWFGEDQDSCQRCKIRQVSAKQLQWFRRNLNRDSVSRKLRVGCGEMNAEKSEFTFRLLWLIFGPPMLQFYTHI